MTSESRRSGRTSMSRKYYTLVSPEASPVAKRKRGRKPKPIRSSLDEVEPNVPEPEPAAPDEDSGVNLSLQGSSRGQSPQEVPEKRSDSAMDMADDPLAAVRRLNPYFYQNSARVPVIENGIAKCIIVLEPKDRSVQLPVKAARTAVMISADAVLKAFVEDPICANNRRYSIQGAYDAFSITLNFFGPSPCALFLYYLHSFVELEKQFEMRSNHDVCLHFRAIETAFALLKMVGPFQPQHITLAHQWIMSNVEPQYLRAYLVMLRYLNFFDGSQQLRNYLCSNGEIPVIKAIDEFITSTVWDPMGHLQSVKVNEFVKKAQMHLFVTDRPADDRIGVCNTILKSLEDAGCIVSFAAAELSERCRALDDLLHRKPTAHAFEISFELLPPAVMKDLTPMPYGCRLKLTEMGGTEPRGLTATVIKTDDTPVTLDDLIANNVTPAIISRFYVEHVIHFFEKIAKFELGFSH